MEGDAPTAGLQLTWIKLSPFGLRNHLMQIKVPGLKVRHSLDVFKDIRS